MHKMQKYLVGLGIFLSGLVFATPTTNVLLTDPSNNRVIEVDGTGTFFWEYGGAGVLNSPQEAIALTNGNILIADTGNNRIIEVTPNKTIVRTLEKITGSNIETFTPVDVRKCMDYTKDPNGTPTLLICDSANNRVIEVKYSDGQYGQCVWEYKPGEGFKPREAEKRPGAGTATFLITEDGWPGTVSIVERGFPNIVKWKYSCDGPRDASWTPCDNVLIVDGSRVIEVKPYPTNGGDIVGTITPDFTPKEAIRMPDGNIMIAGWKYSYPNTATVVEFKGSQSTWESVWSYSTETAGYYGFVDVDLKGIINVAKVKYQNEQHVEMPLTLCGVIVPIYQPIIENPYIVATKTVTPTGPVSPGAILVYTINYTNQGAGTATNVTIIDQIPEGTEFVGGSMSGPGSYAYSNDGTTWGPSATPVQYIKWTIDTIGPGSGGTVGFKVKIK